MKTIKVLILKQHGATGLRSVGSTMIVSRSEAERLSKLGLVKLPRKKKTKK